MSPSQQIQVLNTSNERSPRRRANISISAARLRTELEPQIPAHAEDDDLPVETAALEKIIHAQHPDSLPPNARGICPALLPRQSVQVTVEDVTTAIERIVAGLEKKSRILTPPERHRVAYHEMGHALVAASLPGVDPVVASGI